MTVSVSTSLMKRRRSCWVGDGAVYFPNYHPRSSVTRMRAT